MGPKSPLLQCGEIIFRRVSILIGQGPDHTKETAHTGIFAHNMKHVAPESTGTTNDKEDVSTGLEGLRSLAISLSAEEILHLLRCT